MDNTAKPSKKGLYASPAGTFFVALCCFSPILVVAMGIVGLSALTPYLDYVLFPSLAIMIFVTFSSYKKWKNDCETSLHVCSICKLKYKEEEWAKKCEAWCTEHQSCNLDIIKHATES